MTLKLLPLALVAVLVGCAGAPDESSDADQNAISHEEAAKDFTFTEHTIKDAPASPQSVEKLGIKKWNVYSNIDHKIANVEQAFSGVVAFATDADDDVKFALVINTNANTVSMIEYDKHGPVATTSISQEMFDTLAVDFTMLRDRASAAAKAESGVSTQALGNGARCGLRLAATALSTVAIGTGVAIAAFGIGFDMVGLAFVGGIVGAGALTGDLKKVSVLVAKVATDSLKETTKTCKAAANGN